MPLNRATEFVRCLFYLCALMAWVEYDSGNIICHIYEAMHMSLDIVVQRIWERPKTVEPL